MKILFIYPSIYDSGFNIAKKEVLFNNIHPGLCYLSAICKREGFKDIALIDLRTLTGWEAFRNEISKSKPDVAAITLMSPDYNYATICINIIKEMDARIKIVVGGYHPTVMPEDMIRNTKVDHIVVGEGEIAFPRILRCIEEKKPIERVVKGEMSDVDRLPFIDRELFDCLELPYDFFLPLPFFTILAGRGCSYNCNFCSPAGKLMHGYRIRRRSADNVIEEIKYLRDTYGFRSIQFWDDCFTEDPKWVIEFCDKYKKNDFNQPFVCQSRADIICKNPDMMRALRKAGLIMASIGFESGNDRILKFINKGVTLKQNIEAARICKGLGIKVWAYHMFGLPTEAAGEAWDTVRMIKKIRPYRSSAAFFTPHPGSHFYDYCKQNNLSLIDPHDNFVRFPEVDKPKIKGVDYDLIRRMAAISKDLSAEVKLKIRIERIFAHKRKKAFLLKIEEEIKNNPSINKIAILRMAHKGGRI